MQEDDVPVRHAVRIPDDIDFFDGDRNYVSNFNPHNDGVSDYYGDYDAYSDVDVDDNLYSDTDPNNDPDLNGVGHPDAVHDSNHVDNTHPNIHSHSISNIDRCSHILSDVLGDRFSFSFRNTSVHLYPRQYLLRDRRVFLAQLRPIRPAAAIDLFSRY